MDVHFGSDPIQKRRRPRRLQDHHSGRYPHSMERRCWEISVNTEGSGSGGHKLTQSRSLCTLSLQTLLY